MTQEKHIFRNIQLICTDSVKLRAKVFFPKGPERGCILVTCAMGVPSRFYQKFAQYCADKGFTALIFDYRGVASNDHVKDASLSDWATKDIPAALNYLSKFNTDIHYVGHSVGGQIIGLVSNFYLVKRASFVGVCNGCWWKGEFLSVRLMSFVFLNIYLPISNFIFGRVDCQLLGMGVNFPKSAGREWASWCNQGGYFSSLKNDFEFYGCDDLNTPTLNIRASDDKIASTKTNQAIKNIYPNIDFEDIVIEAQTFIGHTGFFYSSNDKYWGAILGYFGNSLKG